VHRSWYKPETGQPTDLAFEEPELLANEGIEASVTFLEPGIHNQYNLFTASKVGQTVAEWVIPAGGQHNFNEKLCMLDILGRSTPPFSFCSQETSAFSRATRARNHRL
jgi:hypothetical protein